MGASPRFHAILTLGKAHGLKEKILATTRELMRITMDVSEERNWVVHDTWYLESPSGKTFQFRSMPRKDPTYGFIEIDDSKITDLLGRIKRRIDNVSNLRSDILGELQSSP